MLINFLSVLLDGLAINVASTVQLSTFLFGGSTNAKTKLKTEESNVFKIPREEVPEEALLAYAKRDEERKKERMESAAGVGTNADGMCIYYISISC